MTANDNIRHYIGDLETTEDIDLVFKHIFDLMLANGGEGSGLDADMLDGYHASDFAPASLAEEVERCIHTIWLCGRKYEGKEVFLEVQASCISYTSSRYGRTMSLEEFLNMLEDDVDGAYLKIQELDARTDFLQDEALRNKLIKFVNENFRCVTLSNGETECYLDADSVNGISFILVTQYQYDTQYTQEQKDDPHNVFIINDDIEDFDDYATPSLLRAGMNLRFRINAEDLVIEYSIDKGATWKYAMPLFDKTNESGVVEKGILHPTWYEDLKDYMTEHSLTDQSKYPFILYNDDNKTLLDKIRDSIDEINSLWVSGVKLDEDTTYTLKAQAASTNSADVTNAKKGILNLNLDSYISAYVANQLGTIPSDFSVYEKIANKTVGDTIVLKDSRGNNLTDNDLKNYYPSVYTLKKVLESFQTQQNNTESFIENNLKTIADFTNNVYTTYLEVNDLPNMLTGKLNPAQYGYDDMMWTFRSRAIPVPVGCPGRDSNGNKTFTDVIYALDTNNSRGTPSSDTKCLLCNWKGKMTQRTENGDKEVYAIFKRQGNVCQVRMYATVTAWKNVMVKDSDGNTTIDSGLDVQRYIPVLVFPKGFQPALTGYMENVLREFNDYNGFDYFTVITRNDSATDTIGNVKDKVVYLCIINNHGNPQQRNNVLSAQTTNKEGEGRVVLSITWTYFTDDPLFEISQNENDKYVYNLNKNIFYDINRIEEG